MMTSEQLLKLRRMIGPVDRLLSPLVSDAIESVQGLEARVTELESEAVPPLPSTPDADDTYLVVVEASWNAELEEWHTRDGFEVIPKNTPVKRTTP